MERRQEGALETRRSIVKAVKSLLDEKIATSISIEDITTRAGVAKGSFYTYFKRKEDVISEIALSKYDVLKKLVMNSSDSVYKKLCIYLKKSVAIIDKNTLHVAQQWMKCVVAPLDEEIMGIAKYNYDSENISGILLKAVEIGELREDTPVKIITENIMNSYYGAVATWCINKGKGKTLIKSMNNFCDYELNLIIENYKNR